MVQQYINNKVTEKKSNELVRPFQIGGEEKVLVMLIQEE